MGAQVEHLGTSGTFSLDGYLGRRQLRVDRRRRDAAIVIDAVHDA